VRLRDRGQPPFDGAGFQAPRRFGGIGRHGGRSSREARQFPALAEFLKIGPVGAVRFHRVGGFGLADIGFRLGQIGPKGVESRNWGGKVVQTERIGVASRNGI
jgi:hypothetical protein